MMENFNIDECEGFIKSLPKDQKEALVNRIVLNCGIELEDSFEAGSKYFSNDDIFITVYLLGVYDAEQSQKE